MKFKLGQNVIIRDNLSGHFKKKAIISAVNAFNAFPYTIIFSNGNVEVFNDDDLLTNEDSYNDDEYFDFMKEDMEMKNNE